MMEKRILSVDDSPSVRKLVQFTLKSKGYEVTSAENGLEALDLVADMSFDAIILDFEMPFMNGIDVIIEIRKAENKRKIKKKDQAKIIMMTSHNDRMTVHACKSVGCNHFIIKPLSSEGLQEKLRLCNLI